MIREPPILQRRTRRIIRNAAERIKGKHRSYLDLRLETEHSIHSKHFHFDNQLEQAGDEQY